MKSRGRGLPQACVGGADSRLPYARAEECRGYLVIQILVILIVATVMARGYTPQPAGLSQLSSAGVALWTVGPLLALGALAHVIIHFAGARLDKRGSYRMIALADSTAAIARWAGLLWHVLAVLLLGWLDVVRRGVGDLIAVDELLAVLPPLGLMAWLWYAAYPIERRLREATLLRALETGLPVRQPPSRRDYVLMQFRHQVLIVLLPVAVLAAWSEGWWRLLARLDPSGQGPWTAPTHQVVQLAGVVLALALLPPVISRLWNTSRIGPGPLRTDLLDLCAAQGVRIRDVLVWNTHGSSINGAVLGLWGRLRVVLLTDSLLDHLPRDQVQAVMGHEVGHAARRHVPWLLVAVLAATGGCTLVAELVIRGVGLATTRAGLATPESAEMIEALTSLAAWPLALVAGFLLFGIVSRRFEWQADAFAAQHLSGWRRAQPVLMEPVRISPEGAESMIGALRAVSQLNHVPANRWSFRHGSIARRIANLRGLVGLDAAHLPIDGQVRAIKWACGCVLVVVLIAAAVESWPSLGPADKTAPTDSRASPATSAPVAGAAP